MLMYHQPIRIPALLLKSFQRGQGFNHWEPLTNGVLCSLHYGKLPRCMRNIKLHGCSPSAEQSVSDYLSAHARERWLRRLLHASNL